MGDISRIRPAMTLRVYKVNAERQITYDSGTRGFSWDPEKGTATSPASVVRGGFPPCECPHCRRSK